MIEAFTDRDGDSTPGGPATAIGVCLASMSFYPLYAGPGLRFQRYAPGLQQRGVKLRVFTQAVSQALIARDGAILRAIGSARDGSPGNGRSIDPVGADGVRPDGAHPNQTAIRPAGLEVVDGLPVQRVDLPGGWRREPAYFRRLADYCRKLPPGEINVVQLLNADLLAAPWLLELRRLGLSTVFTYTLLGSLAAGGWKRTLQRLHRRLPLQMVDVVVVSSAAMRAAVLELGVSTPVEVIPNGVDLKRFHPASETEQKARLRQELGWDPAWEVILAIGPIIPRKGVDVLVEAFVSLAHRHPRARLVLVGPRHDLARADLSDFHTHLDRLIAGAGAQERVLFAGAVSNVQTYLQAADLFVFPSRREGMPNVVPEAMATGLPVIMTPFTGLPVEFGRAGEHYLLTDWQPACLAAEIEELLGNLDLRHRLGHNGYLWVAGNLDVERSLDAYVDLYRRLQAKRHGHV